MLVNDSDVVLFVGEMLSEGGAYLARPENDNFHWSADPPIDRSTP
jgi:hypothetical protein